ncbi:MAG: hypothetical protein AB7O24_30140, partial [Kofleriaceae bacterium]
MLELRDSLDELAGHGVERGHAVCGATSREASHLGQLQCEVENLEIVARHGGHFRRGRKSSEGLSPN